MSWHVDVETLARYQKGSIDRVAAASVEGHITSCPDCRSSIARDSDWLERSWLGIADAVEPSPPSLAERALVRIGVPAHWARLVAASPALRLSFLLAVALVLGFAVGASRSNPEGNTYRIFLIVAPLLPVIGVGFAYGRMVDPAFELTMASPVDSLRLLLLRATTVLSLSIVLGVIAWPFVPVPGVLGASAWLLPALALTLLTLALASRFEMWMSATMAAFAWGAALFIASAREVDVFAPRSQFVYLILAGVAGLAIAMRRHSYDRNGGLR